MGGEGGGAAGGGQVPRRVLQVQRTRSREPDARSGSDPLAAMRKELEELRAASRLDAQRMFASHTRDVEALVGAQSERVTAIIDPVTEAVAATNVRVSKLEHGHDELAVVVGELTAQVAELTTPLAAA